MSVQNTSLPISDPPPEGCLGPTDMIDSRHPAIVSLVQATLAAAAGDPALQAAKLYEVARDSIWYDPYTPFYRPEHYRASSVLQRGRAFCIPKAVLLCALGRAAGIPTRLGFATVRNHLATQQLIDYVGSDLFVYHGFVEFHIEKRWVKATPAFNRELCRRHGVAPLTFDGRHDSIFQPYNTENKRFMEYVEDHGTFSDVPLESILEAWKRVYGRRRVLSWIEAFEAGRGGIQRDFYGETVLRT